MLSRRRGYSAKTYLLAWYVVPRSAFKAKVWQEDETAWRREIKQQEAVRQSNENIIRTGSTRSFEVVEKNWMFLSSRGFLSKSCDAYNRHLGGRGNRTSWVNLSCLILLIILCRFLICLRVGTYIDGHFVWFSIIVVVVFMVPEKVAFRSFEIPIAQKQKLSRRRGHSAKTCLLA